MLLYVGEKDSERMIENRTRAEQVKFKKKITEIQIIEIIAVL